MDRGTSCGTESPQRPHIYDVLVGVDCVICELGSPDQLLSSLTAITVASASSQPCPNISPSLTDVCDTGKSALSISWQSYWTSPF